MQRDTHYMHVKLKSPPPLCYSILQNYEPLGAKLNFNILLNQYTGTQHSNTTVMLFPIDKTFQLKSNFFTFLLPPPNEGNSFYLIVLLL